MTDWWTGRRVLITGHTGFKGSWLALWLCEHGAEVTGIALDPESEDGAFNLLAPWPGLRDERLDLTRSDLAPTIARAAPEVVFHFAAQSLVSQGLQYPVDTYRTNVIGTVRLLEALRSLEYPVTCVVATTDKVYKNDHSGRRFEESEPLGGNDPYSTSKACVELILEQWRRDESGGMRLVSVRCGNVIGGGDRSVGRLIPDVVRSACSREPLKLRSPLASRPWVFVLDALDGYLRIAKSVSCSESFVPAVNIGPSEGAHVVTVSDLARLAAQAIDEAILIVPGAHVDVEDVPLQLDSRLAEKVIGWRPRLTIEESVAWTAQWERGVIDGLDMRSITVDQARRYDGLAQ
jgi:CDP-glucose 4,6-dehydratase